MKPDKHMYYFQWGYNSTANLAKFVYETIDRHGCDVGFGALKQGAKQLGLMDADYAGMPDDHPQKKKMLRMMKQSHAGVADAKALFEDRCMRPPGGRGRR